MQGGVAFSADGVDIGTMLDQQFRDFRSAIFDTVIKNGTRSSRTATFSSSFLFWVQF
jgi:hypothetical protein